MRRSCLFLILFSFHVSPLLVSGKALIIGVDLSNEDFISDQKSILFKGKNPILTKDNAENLISKLFNKEIDACIISRPFSRKEARIISENNINWISSQRIMWRVMAIAVNKNNSISYVSDSTLQRIFKGEILNWKSITNQEQELMPIVLDYSGDADMSFVNDVIVKYPIFGKNCLKKRDLNDVIKRFDGHDGCICILDYSVAIKYPTIFKVIGITIQGNNIDINTKSIVNREYPYRYPIWLFWDDKKDVYRSVNSNLNLYYAEDELIYKYGLMFLRNKH
ncbi:MAG: hypothetical protein A2487_19315 [Candidatus Raymondbacteria bacterium RifOxyC12_full_50_8]|nr:MAG: hypothetical protein A2487_19315 [Candidatus Raymondbacteria bacterium RifOxyC12_full_50_8]